MKKWKQTLSTSQSMPGYTLLLGVVLINVLVQGTSFFTKSNFGSIFSVNAPLILAAIAQTIVVLTGGIDLSIGSTMTLVNAIAIVLPNQYGWPILSAWLLAIIIGTIVGFMNGTIIANFRIPPLLATFATMSIVGGVALWILPKPGGTVPRMIYRTYRGFVLGIPTSLWIIAIVVLLWFFISKNPIGRYIRAVGGNERSAYASALPTKKVKIFAYTLTGFITAIAGLSLTALTASGDPTIGLKFSLNSIAAVIIGGAKLSGGWGGVGGSIAGGLFLGLVSNVVFFLFYNYIGMFPNLGNLSSFIQQLLSGLIVILGLASAGFTQRSKFSTKLQ